MQRWVRRFRRLCREKPASVGVFVAAGTPTVVAMAEDGGFCLDREGGHDRDGIIEGIVAPGWDGGDW